LKKGGLLSAEREGKGGKGKKSPVNQAGREKRGGSLSSGKRETLFGGERPTTLPSLAKKERRGR